MEIGGRKLKFRVSETFKVILRRICRRVEIRGADSLMVGGGMMLGKIIGTIGFAFIPENLELALADAIADPIKAHIDGFGSFLLDGVALRAK